MRINCFLRGPARVDSDKKTIVIKQIYNKIRTSKSADYVNITLQFMASDRKIFENNDH